MSSGSLLGTPKRTSSNLPQHVGIIMDGNGRWAQRRGLERMEGLQEGFENILEITSVVAEKEIGQLTLYAFSTENWSRPDDEIRFIMHLSNTLDVNHFIERLNTSRVSFRHIGRRDRLPSTLNNFIDRLTVATASNIGMTLAIAFDYGGRDDIVRAVKKMATDGYDLKTLTEQKLQASLATADMPPLDLIIRAGGEMRISNFMLWDAAYAELYFTPKLWPDFDSVEFNRALEEYVARERRFGGL